MALSWGRRRMDKTGRKCKKPKTSHVPPFLLSKSKDVGATLGVSAPHF